MSEVENAAANAEQDDNENKDDPDMSGADGEDGDDGDIKQEYVKKEFVARPYTSETGVLEHVQRSIIKESRPLMQMRITRQRALFGQDGFNFIEKDGSEYFMDMKGAIKNISLMTRKKVLEMGLQAASQIKRTQTQTYFGRSVNKACQYNADDFITQMSNFKGDDQMEEKLDKFIDRVAFRIEEALQSNEIINVFQDDFEMLADEIAAQGGKINSVKMTPRTFSESEYCHLKRVSCIKFHPTKPHLVAMSMIEYLKFSERAAITGKSFDSNVLIMNFSDSHIITLSHVLETPIEISTIEFHPENPNVIIGGCLNGQTIVWDITSTDHRITAGKKSSGDDQFGGDGDDFNAATAEVDDKQQSIIKMKHLSQSSIIASHKNFVGDIVFIPPSINVDKRATSDGKYTHFISISEDGIVNIWDTRPVSKEQLQLHNDYTWKPYQQLILYKQDGSGELGLSRALIDQKTTTPTFWATSDDGDLVLIDWSVKSVGTGDDGPKITEYVKFTYESEKEYRPALALERSPFYPNLLLTVHNFHFSIWKIDLDNYEKPIFNSAPSINTAHNTCGAFSPTRPGVVFITKTDGIDVWDFLDGSFKPSLTLNFATSVITYMRFQHYKHSDQRQYMAFGDEKDGTLFLWEVPSNLKTPLPNEQENIEIFWQREVDKCNFVVEQREIKKEEYTVAKAEKEKQIALAEQAKEISEEALKAKEQEQEDKYQDLLLQYKEKFGMITEDELASLQAKKKKK